MALVIFLLAVGAGVALYAGLLRLAARSKRAVGPRPEARESYRDAEPVAVVVEPSEHFVGTMAGGVLFEHPGPGDGCPICRSLSAWDAQRVERPCSPREATHNGTPVEATHADRRSR